MSDYKYFNLDDHFMYFEGFLRKRKMLVEGCWLLLGTIHAMPSFALVMPSLLTKLYGVDARKGSGDGSASLAVFVLMRHRAALFAAVTATCVYAVVDRGSRRLACIVVGTSMLSFLALYLIHGSPPPIKQIALADLLGLPALACVVSDAFVA